MSLQRDEIRNWIIYGSISLLLTIGTVVLALGPGLNLVMQRAVQRLPLSIENDLGGRLLGHLVRADANQDPELKVILQKCAGALREPGEEREYEVLLVENPEVNAFALPGGHLVLYRGLVDKLQDQHELMSVLGHEAGHVRHRHFLQRLARAASIGAVFTLLAGDTTGLVAVMFDSGKELLQKGYSRTEEQVADDEGLKTLQRLGLDTHGADRAMQRLIDAGGGNLLPEVLSTHPDTESRRQRLMLAAQALPQGTKVLLTPAEWTRLKLHDSPAKKSETDVK